MGRAGKLRIIVLGTDFSVASRPAVTRARTIASTTGAVVHVVHAAPRIPRALARRFSFGDDRKLEQALDGVVEELLGAGVRASSHLVQGDPVEVLTAKARSVAADLVIVGSRGRAMPDAVLGSTAERLVARDQHRVLLARRGGPSPYAQVLIAANEDSDLRGQVQAAALLSSRPAKVLRAFEGAFEWPIQLHGATNKELNSYRADVRREVEASMAIRLEQAGLEPSQLVLRHGHAVALLQRVPRDTLLVLSRRRSRLGRLLLGSVTRAVIAYGGSDVLLV